VSAQQNLWCLVKLCETACCKWLVALQIIGVEHCSLCPLMYVSFQSIGKFEADAHSYHSMFQAIT